jgi:hypothetical protein
VRVFTTKAFARFARKERVTDDELCLAIARASRGLVDADLGGGIIKQRVPRPGEGRSGGFRTLLAIRFESRAVFLFGFAKKEVDNVEPGELRALRRAASEVLGWDDRGVAALVAAGSWTEVFCHD